MINRTLYKSSLDVNEKPEPNMNYIYEPAVRLCMGVWRKSKKDERGASPVHSAGFIALCPNQSLYLPVVSCPVGAKATSSLSGLLIKLGKPYA